MLNATYKELLSLGQLYLLQEYGWQDLLVVDPQIIKEQKLRNAPIAPAIRTEAPPPPVKNAPMPIRKPPEPAISAQQALPPKIEKKSPEPAAAPPLSQPVAQQTEKPTTEKPFFELQPMGPSSARDFGDLLRVIQQVYPTFPYTDRIPDDKEARTIGRQWDLNALDAEIVILSFTTVPKQLAFLQNLAKALRFQGQRAAVIDAQNIEEAQGWEKIIENSSIKRLIASDYGIYTLAKLMSLVKITATGQHYIGKVPLFLMADVALYFKEPHLKAALWKSLSEEPSR